MRLKLDENLSRHLKTELTALGHDVDTVADEGLLSAADPVVGLAAKDAGRVLMTLDVEFADLRKYRPGTHPGIVLFRPARRSIRTTNEMVMAFAALLDQLDVNGSVVVVDDTRVRIRRPGE
ncbi:DUF5615 family PIN-like protein [Sorangium sp. So ce1128]